VVVNNFQPGIGDICADPTGLQVKVEDIDIYNYVHFTVIEGGHRVKTKQGCQEVDLRQFQVDSICVTCHQILGEHVGLRCPDGKGEFVSREQVMKEIESDENKTTSGQMSCVAFLRRFTWVCHDTGYRKAAVVEEPPKRPETGGIISSSKMIERSQLRNELVELLHEQLDALEIEIFVGLTDQDIRQYQARAARIHELSREIHDTQTR
jgi:hypothetical protein